MEYPQLGFALAFGAFAGEQPGLLPASRDAVELAGRVEHQPGAFFGVGGAQQRDAEKQGQRDQSPLQRLPPHAAVEPVVFAAFQDHRFADRRGGEAEGLLEQASVFERGGEIMQGLALEQQPPVHQVVAQLQAAHDDFGPFVPSERHDDLGLVFAVGGENLDGWHRHLP